MKSSLKKKRIILSAGGTGGHLYPAQALARELEEEADLLFVASNLSKNRFFDQTFPYQDISAGPIPFSQPLRALKGLMACTRGFFEALRLLKKFEPSVVVGFGSFHTLPLLAAAKFKNIPIVLHEQNAILGKVNRLFAPSAALTCFTFPFPNKKSNLKKKE